MATLVAKEISYCSKRQAVGCRVYRPSPLHSAPRMSSMAGSVRAMMPLRRRHRRLGINCTCARAVDKIWTGKLRLALRGMPVPQDSDLGSAPPTSVLPLA